jgi:hypothetical protein
MGLGPPLQDPHLSSGDDSMPEVDTRLKMILSWLMANLINQMVIPSLKRSGVAGKNDDRITHYHAQC